MRDISARVCVCVYAWHELGCSDECVWTSALLSMSFRAAPSHTRIIHTYTYRMYIAIFFFLQRARRAHWKANEQAREREKHIAICRCCCFLHSFRFSLGAICVQGKMSISRLQNAWWFQIKYPKYMPSVYVIFVGSGSFTVSNDCGWE